MLWTSILACVGGCPVDVFVDHFLTLEMDETQTRQGSAQTPTRLGDVPTQVRG